MTNQTQPDQNQSNQINDLEKQIDRQQTLLNMYEDNLRLEDDPRRRLKIQENIEEVKTLLLGYQTRLAKLREPTGPPANPQTEPGRSLPPAPLITNAPYGLETAIVGRVDERLLLDDWFQRDADHPFLAVIGLGGQGKSALTWDWMQDLRDGGQAPPLLIWWSFYESDGTMDKLMATMLRHFGDDPSGFPNLRTAVDRFLQHLQTNPALIILDGAERLLRAYSSMAAAYQGDDDAPSGPQQAAAHQCVDGVTGQLLVWLCDPRLTQAQTLMTSRLFPKELSGRAGATLAGVRRLDLPGLSPNAAVQLFNKLGIRATRAEVEAVCEPLGYHPLSLRLLAQTAAEDPKYRNDIRAAVDFDPTLDLLGKRQHVLNTAYNSLPSEAQTLLGQLAAFRSSIAYEAIESIFGDQREHLITLERRGLVQTSQRQEPHASRPTNHYNLHPIVRRYAYSRLTNASATHVLVVTYFEAMPEPEHVQSIDDLLPTIELYHHLVQAERYDGAKSLLQDRLVPNPLYFQLGAYQLCIDLLTALFPDGLDRPPHLSDERSKGWTLNSLANSYSLAGQPAAAIPFFEGYIEVSEKRDDKTNLAIGLINAADDQIHVGKLAQAAGNLRRSIGLCQEIENRYLEAVGHQNLGLLLALCGDWAGAEAKLEIAKIEFDTGDTRSSFTASVRCYISEAALLQNQPECAQSAAKEALAMADETARVQYPHERDYVRCHWLLGWAALDNAQLAAAQDHLDEALRRCRAINLVEFEPKILLAHARLAVENRQPDDAQSLLTEAQTIAERAGYVLDLADIHNLLAQLALDGGDREAARVHARAARDYAWCDGPPYAYQVALDEADRLIREA